MIKLFRTPTLPVALIDTSWFLVKDIAWDALFNHSDLAAYLSSNTGASDAAQEPDTVLHPVGEQEIWAAGVTYYRSRTARMAESEKAGGGTFYDKVYEAERPELFYKGSKRNVVGPGTAVAIRRDSKWNVPEPELTLAINSSGELIGFTVGNDMSSRDIEGENPLYLPQAKVYDASCALGPCVLLQDSLSPETKIQMSISRGGDEVFSGETEVSNIKRSFAELIDFLYRENTFPNGCFLMTGTGIVPPDSFSLQTGDTIAITIEEIGTLTNTVG